MNIGEFLNENIDAYYKVQDDWLKTIRFFNDISWYVYSLVGVLPLFFVVIYRFINHPKNLEKYSDKNPVPADRVTLMYKIFVFYPHWYYFIDNMVSLLEGSFMDECRWPFFYHHVISFPVLFLVNQEEWVPWFMVATGAWHAFLILLPDIFFMNIPYVALLLYVHYRLLTDKAFQNFRAMNYLRIWYPTFYFAILFLGVTGCENILPNM
ncbi:hypothetical protein PPERSA_00870 [Pseudocohnilembus persalinus]|uniref:Uncharacterized protein n=1 Tax=Pseudocohnilembus persalinus TaxID=266149 RepID=A0A0V0QEP1_PSEPJ|nr:hypothetical protein PPERSA_00870 [Pseudocohnilembus persalinus]|eukprot:KRX00643.1 hypothetical protein PPERSA_00870 [Pseudocohnilembus persalinus]